MTVEMCNDLWKKYKKLGQPIPVDFEESNKVLTKPPGMTDEECGPLPVFNDGQQSISCWQLPWRDRLRVLITGKVWLGVLMGVTQPPVYIAARKPLRKAE